MAVMGFSACTVSSDCCAEARQTSGIITLIEINFMQNLSISLTAARMKAGAVLPGLY